ncbi:unnamed protein product [Sphagnum balticum]
MAPTGLSSQQPPRLPLIVIRPLLLVVPVGKQQQAALTQSSRSDDGMAAPATYMVQGGYDQNRSSSDIWSFLVDFRGHWLLILLGIALFTTMGAV